MKTVSKGANAYFDKNPLRMRKGERKRMNEARTFVKSEMDVL